MNLHLQAVSRQIQPMATVSHDEQIGQATANKAALLHLCVVDIHF